MPEPLDHLAHTQEEATVYRVDPAELVSVPVELIRVHVQEHRAPLRQVFLGIHRSVTDGPEILEQLVALFVPVALGEVVVDHRLYQVKPLRHSGQLHRRRPGQPHLVPGIGSRDEVPHEPVG